MLPVGPSRITSQSKATRLLRPSLREMDENDTAGILGRLDFGGHSRERSLLVNPKLFLRHTVLHELAHLENNWGQAYEDECDSWAFERLSAQWRG